MPDKKNRTSTNDIIITDKGLAAFKTFGSIINTRLLHRGMRLMLNYSLRCEISSEIWFDDFLEELKVLNDFIDEMEDEYG